MTRDEVDRREVCVIGSGATTRTAILTHACLAPTDATSVVVLDLSPSTAMFDPFAPPSVSPDAPGERTSASGRVGPWPKTEVEADTKTGRRRARQAQRAASPRLDLRSASS